MLIPRYATTPNDINTLFAEANEKDWWYLGSFHVESCGRLFLFREQPQDVISSGMSSDGYPKGQVVKDMQISDRRVTLKFESGYSVQIKAKFEETDTGFQTRLVVER
jgi:hypothetical protein